MSPMLNFSPTEWYTFLIFASVWFTVLPVHILICVFLHKRIEWHRIGAQFILQVIMILSLLYPNSLLVPTLSASLYFIAREFILLNKGTIYFSDNFAVLCVVMLPFFYGYMESYVNIYLIIVATLFLMTQILIKGKRSSTSSIYTFFLLIILGNAFCFYIPLRHLPSGFEWCFFAVSAAKLTDISAYIIGGFYKGHYFINKNVSRPKSIDVMLVCYGINALYAFLLSYVFFPSYSLAFILCTSVVITFFAQFGDLTFSLLKRNAKVKNFGNALPGIGGVADWVDSLVFLPVPLYLLILMSN